MKTIFAALILLIATSAIAQDQPAIKVTTCHSGDWITPASEGEGYNMNVLPDGLATFYFYTYLDELKQAYFTGVLEPLENNILQGVLYMSLGGRMFSDQNPSTVQRSAMMELTLSLYADSNSRSALNTLKELIFFK